MKLLKEKFMNKITRISLSLMMLALFAAGGCRDDHTIIDPRTGEAFTAEAMVTLAKFAEECEVKGKLSKQSLQVLVKHHGFKKKQRKQLRSLCQKRVAALQLLN
jgi:hypothetical protein